MRRIFAFSVILSACSTSSPGTDGGPGDSGGPDTSAEDAAPDVKDAAAVDVVDAQVDVAVDVATDGDAGKPIDNQLVGLWPLSETSAGTAPDGGDFADLSGNGDTGKAVGGVTFAAATGVVGKAVGLNGSTGYVLTGANAPEPNNAMSVSAWIKANSLQGAYPQIVTAGDSTGLTGYNLYLFSPAGQGQAAFILKEGTNAWATCWAYGGSNLQDSAWHNLVGVYTGTTITIYVDGVQKATSSSCSNLTINYGTSANGEIGAKANGQAGTFFSGDIQQAAVWNRALTTTEITALYNGGAGMTLP